MYEIEDKQNRELYQQQRTAAKKDWVKNTAIVFLSIMLVLTFFSNTIMNYSLPQVATQFVQQGSVTPKVRGSGVAEVEDPYSVKAPNGSAVKVILIRHSLRNIKLASFTSAPSPSSRSSFSPLLSAMGSRKVTVTRIRSEAFQ